MAEIEKDLHLDEDEGINRVEKRIKDLSSKAEEEAKRATVEAEARAKAEAERLAAEKDRDFYKGFSSISSKYSGASEHLEDIRSKVLAGYDIEDATVSVLNRAGKLSTPNVERESPAGGSATTNLPSSGKKAIADMTQEERRAALAESLSMN